MHTGDDDLSRHLRLLRLRLRASAVAIIFLWTAFVLSLWVWVGGNIIGAFADPTALLVTGLLLGMGCLYAMVPLINVSFVRHAGAVLNQFDNLIGIHHGGFFAPRLTCVVDSGRHGVPPLTLRFVGGIAYEGGADPATIHLELPWTSTTDLAVVRKCSYSDTPSIVPQMEELRRTLRGSDHVWTHVRKRRIESEVPPRWGLILKPSESSESVFERVIGRWRWMEALRQVAQSGSEFAPRVQSDDGVDPDSIGPFSRGVWCPRCHRPVLVPPRRNPKSCRKCGGETVQVYFRDWWFGSLKRKMEQVRSPESRLS